MAYLAGFFDEKIPIDFSQVVPASDTGRAFTVKVTKEPLMEQAAGTLRAKVETVVSSLITARISSIAVWAGDEVQAGQVLVTLDSRELEARAETYANLGRARYLTGDRNGAREAFAQAIQLSRTIGPKFRAYLEELGLRQPRRPAAKGDG